MDNYEVLEVIHASRTSETIILKVKEKNKRICDKVYALKLIGSLNNRFQKLIFKREVDALKTLNSCDNYTKICLLFVEIWTSFINLMTQIISLLRLLIIFVNMRTSALLYREVKYNG